MLEGSADMRFYPLVRLFSVSVVIIMLVSCAVAPTQEMSDARQAIEAAREAGAADLAPENLRRAESRLQMAGEEIESRAFFAARKDALSAQGQARRALELVRVIRAAEEAIARAEGVGNDVSEARRLLQEANNAAFRGDDREAMRLAELARERVYQP